MATYQKIVADFKWGQIQPGDILTVTGDDGNTPGNVTIRHDKTGMIISQPAATLATLAKTVQTVEITNSKTQHKA